MDYTKREIRLPIVNTPNLRSISFRERKWFVAFLWITLYWILTNLCDNSQQGVCSNNNSTKHFQFYSKVIYFLHQSSGRLPVPGCTNNDVYGCSGVICCLPCLEDADKMLCFFCSSIMSVFVISYFLYGQ